MAKVLEIALVLTLKPMILSFGSVSNIFNIVLFRICGLTDGVTIGLYWLSVSDLGFSLTQLVLHILKILPEVSISTTVDLSSWFFIISWYSAVFFDTSMLITVYIAIQKCCCVALPFTFRNVFTPLRTKITIVILFASMLALYSPIYSSMQLLRQGNNTQLTLKLSNHWSDAVLAIQLNRMITPLLSEVTVIVCLFIITFSLRRAIVFKQALNETYEPRSKSRVRTENKINSENKDSADIGPPGGAHMTAPNDAQSATLHGAQLGKQKKKEQEGIPSKEIQATKAVQVVTFIFVVCNFPEILMSLVPLLIPQFGYNRRYHNLWYVLYNIQRFLPALNASVNIFVYLKFNSKFSRSFRSLFRLQRKKT